MSDEILQILVDAAKINFIKSVFVSSIILVISLVAIAISILLFIFEKPFNSVSELVLVLALFLFGLLCLTLSGIKLYENYTLSKNDSYIYKYLLEKRYDCN